MWSSVTPTDHMMVESLLWMILKGHWVVLRSLSSFVFLFCCKLGGTLLAALFGGVTPTHSDF